jgi:hypothetical protein
MFSIAAAARRKIAFGFNAEGRAQQREAEHPQQKDGNAATQKAILPVRKGA